MVSQSNSQTPDEKNPLPDYRLEDQSWYTPLPLEEERSATELPSVHVEVVLIVAVEVELKAVLRRLHPLANQQAVLRVVKQKETYYIGRFGSHNTVVTMCRMGYGDQGTAMVATGKAIQIWQPKAVIMVGIAFGKDPLRQNIGDVLVSSQIICYQSQRVGADGEVVHRGPIVPAGSALLNRFRNVLRWEFKRPDDIECQRKDGPLLSGEVLVDDPEFKARLFKQFPQAIGGEMEGVGVYVGSAEHNTEWIIVKAICDWADGKKGAKHQPLAAASAVSLVEDVLSNRHALSDLSPAQSQNYTSAPESMHGDSSSNGSQTTLPQQSSVGTDEAGPGDRRHSLIDPTTTRLTGLTLSILEEQRADSVSEIHALRQQNQELNQELISLLKQNSWGAANLSHRAISDNSPEPIALHEQVLSGRIDEARDRIREGKVKTARIALFRIRSDAETQQASEAIQFRIATNLGVCALELDENEIARNEFRAALRYQPNHPDALCNAAAIALLDGDALEAFSLSSRVRQTVPEHTNATSIYVQALLSLGHPERLQKLLVDEPWILADSVCNAALGHQAFHTQRYGDAEGYLRASLELDPLNPQAEMLLAQSIVVPLQKTLHADPPLLTNISEDILARLRESDEAFTRAVSLLREHEYRLHLLIVLGNRAGVRIMLGRTEEALQDCDYVLAENPTLDYVWRNKAMISFMEGDMKQALRCFERVQDGEEKVACAIPSAIAYIETGNPARAISLVEPIYQRVDTTDRTQHVLLADVLLHAHFANKEESICSALANSLLEAYPHDPDALTVVARQRKREGNLADAVDLLQRAMAESSGHQIDRTALELANLYILAENFPEAAEALERIANVETDEALATKLVVCLYNAGKTERTARLARQLRQGAGHIIPKVSELEALALEYAGHFQAARDLRVQLSSYEPHEVDHRVRVAILEFRLGNDQAAIEAIRQIEFDEVKHDSLTLMQLAQVRVVLGLPEVLRYAYQARRVGFSNPDIHMAYIALVMGSASQNDALPKPTHVEIDCTVTLQHDKETQTYTIIEGDDLNLERGEIAPTDVRAVKLSGAKKADQIVLGSGAFDSLAYTVVDIQSKYGYAFRQSMRNFSTWFPTHGGLVRLALPKGGNVPNHAVLDTHRKRLTTCHALYETASLPSNVYAQMTGRSNIDLWRAQVSLMDAGLWATSGQRTEFEAQVATILNTNTIVMDVTACLTMCHLGLAEHMRSYFQRIIVPQDVLNQVTEALLKAIVDGSPRSRGRHPAPHFLIYQTDIWEQFLRNVRTFITTSTEVVPVASALETDIQVLVERETEPDEGMNASVLVAQEHKAVLFTDNLGMSITAGEGHVVSVWSQPVLLALQKMAKLSIDQYYCAVEQLILSNYRFVFINADGLFWTLKRYRFSNRVEVEKVFQLLTGPQCEEYSAVRVIAWLLRLVWKDQKLRHVWRWTTGMCCEALAARRYAGVTLAKLRLALTDACYGEPTLFQMIDAELQRWERNHLTGRIGIAVGAVSR